MPNSMAGERKPRAWITAKSGELSGTRSNTCRQPKRHFLAGGFDCFARSSVGPALLGLGDDNPNIEKEQDHDISYFHRFENMRKGARSMGVGILSWIAFFVWALSEIVIVVRAKRLRRGVVSLKVDKWSSWLIRVSIYLGTGVAFSFHSFRWGWVGQPIADMSAILMLMGTALRLWSIHVLGKNFTTELSIDSGQELIKDGPYKLIRHPSYTGSLLTLVFLGFAFNSWIASCILLLMLLPCFIHRINIEENALRSYFGSMYSEYRQATWSLIPYLW